MVALMVFKLLSSLFFETLLKELSVYEECTCELNVFYLFC